MVGVGVGEHQQIDPAHAGAAECRRDDAGSNAGEIGRARVVQERASIREPREDRKPVADVEDVERRVTGRGGLEVPHAPDHEDGGHEREAGRAPLSEAE